MRETEYIKDEKKAKDLLSSHITKKRFDHSMRVAKVAKDLAIRFDINPDEACFCGMLHDIAKEMSLAQMTQFACLHPRYEFLPIEHKQNKDLLHGYASAQVTKKYYPNVSSDIMNAITYHTTGRGSMSLLEKVVFAADYIEPKRLVESAVEARRLALADIDKTVIYILKSTIKYLVDSNHYISTDSIDALNQMMSKY